MYVTSLKIGHAGHEEVFWVLVLITHLLHMLPCHLRSATLGHCGGKYGSWWADDLRGSLCWGRHVKFSEVQSLAESGGIHICLLFLGSNQMADIFGLWGTSELPGRNSNLDVDIILLTPIWHEHAIMLHYKFQHSSCSIQAQARELCATFWWLTLNWLLLCPIINQRT